jgi:hypothetical protein
MTLKAMLAFGALAMLAAFGGCYASGQASVATPDPLTVYELHPDDAPPPPQDEVYVLRPGMMWVGGHWSWDDGQWVWHKGFYEQIREGYHWEPGHHGPHRVWVEGHWAR